MLVLKNIAKPYVSFLRRSCTSSISTIFSLLTWFFKLNHYQSASPVIFDARDKGFGVGTGPCIRLPTALDGIILSTDDHIVLILKSHRGVEIYIIFVLRISFFYGNAVALAQIFVVDCFPVHLSAYLFYTATASSYGLRIYYRPQIVSRLLYFYTGRPCCHLTPFGS